MKHDSTKKRRLAPILVALLVLVERLPSLPVAIALRGVIISPWARVSKVSATLAGVWTSTMHSVTGATSTVSAVAPFSSRETSHEGESFLWAFRSQGQSSKSYTVEGLPPGLVYEGLVRSGGVSTITGTPTRAGNYLVTIIGWEFEGERGASTDPFALNLTVLPPASFEAWAAFQGLPEYASAAMDDPDRDGIDNLLEYAFGLHPLSTKVPQETLRLPFRPPGLAADDLSIAYIRRRSDARLRYHAEFSENLVDWKLGTSEELIEIDDIWEGVLVAPPPSDGKKRGYVRVRVEHIKP